MAQGPVWGGGCRGQWKGAWGEGADQTGPGRSLDFSLWMTSLSSRATAWENFQPEAMTWADLGLGKLTPGIQQVLFVRKPVQPSQEGQTGEMGGAPQDVWERQAGGSSPTAYNACTGKGRAR